MSESGRIRGEGAPINEGEGYAKDKRGVYIGGLVINIMFISICEINVGDCLAVSFRFPIFV